MPNTLARLGHLSVEDFLSEYWQQKPVLLRGVFPADFCPVTPEELMAFACSEDADARLIVADAWPPELYHGPFEPDELEDVPEGDWTLLVQEMDRLHLGAAGILDCFRFIPNWRVDDLMISFAAPGGGVGAHTDQYDVFLIQGLGNRRWEIDPTPNPEPTWKPDSEIAVLAEFDAVEAWEVEPGDVLYLPPHVAHNGVALTECMTLSVGFRAPAPCEILESVIGYVAEAGLGSKRYLDPVAQTADDPGRLSAVAMGGLRAQIGDLLADPQQLDRWIGRHLTEPVRGRTGVPNSGGLPGRGVLRAASASQVAFLTQDGSVILFAAGREFELGLDAEEAVSSLTGVEGLDLAGDMPPALRPILDTLFEEGVLRLDS